MVFGLANAASANSCPRLTQIPAMFQDPSGVEPAPLPANVDQLLYNEAKMLCPAYQVAKERLIEAFDKAKLGRWIKKPIEQDQFVCELADAAPEALFAWAGPAPNRSAAQRPATGRDTPHLARERNYCDHSSVEEDCGTGDANDCEGGGKDCGDNRLNDRVEKGNDRVRNLSYAVEVEKEDFRQIRDDWGNCGVKEENGQGEAPNQSDGVNRGKEIDRRVRIDSEIKEVISWINSGVNLVKEEYSQCKERNDCAIKEENHSIYIPVKEGLNDWDNNGINRFKGGIDKDIRERIRNNCISQEKNKDYRNFCINVQINVGKKQIGANENYFSKEEGEHNCREINRSRNVKYDGSTGNQYENYWKGKGAEHCHSRKVNENYCPDVTRARNEQRHFDNRYNYLGSVESDWQSGNHSTVRDVRETRTNEIPNNDRFSTSTACRDNERIPSNEPRISRISQLLAKRAAYNKDESCTVVKLRQPRFNDDVNNENDKVDGVNNFHSHQHVLKEKSEVIDNQPDSNKVNVVKSTDETVFKNKNSNTIFEMPENSAKLITKLKQLRIGNKENNLIPNNEFKDGTWLERFNSTQCRSAVNDDTENYTKETDCRENECAENQQLQSNLLRKLLLLHKARK